MRGEQAARPRRGRRPLCKQQEAGARGCRRCTGLPRASSACCAAPRGAAGGQVPQDGAAAAEQNVVAELQDEDHHRGHRHPHRHHHLLLGWVGWVWRSHEERGREWEPQRRWRACGSVGAAVRQGMQFGRGKGAGGAFGIAQSGEALPPLRCLSSLPAPLLQCASLAATASSKRAARRELHAAGSGGCCAWRAFQAGRQQALPCKQQRASWPCLGTAELVQQQPRGCAARLISRL